MDHFTSNFWLRKLFSGETPAFPKRGFELNNLEQKVMLRDFD